MRFGRTFLAGLAPLIGLSALMAAMTAEPGVSNTHRPLVRFLQTVVQLATPAVETSVTSSPERPSPQTVLAYAGLAAAPFSNALLILASMAVINLVARRHQ